MLEDDLCAIPPNKHHREGIVAFDPAHELDPVHKEHRHINVVVAEMLQEGVLKAEGALYCHCPSLWERFIQDAALHDSAAPPVLSMQSALTILFIDGFREVLLRETTQPQQPSLLGETSDQHGLLFDSPAQ
jgi:hypothetical protein